MAFFDEMSNYELRKTVEEQAKDISDKLEVSSLFWLFFSNFFLNEFIFEFSMNCLVNAGKKLEIADTKSTGFTLNVFVKVCKMF